MAAGVLQEPTYYEILEVEATATQEEIEAAYRRLSGYLASDSLVVYALLDDDELERQRHALDAAYRTLSDPHRRAEYDRELSGRETSTYPEVQISVSMGREDWTAPRHEGGVSNEAAGGAGRVDGRPAEASGSVPASKERGFRLPPDVELGPDTEYSGAVLRRLRELVGASADDIAAVTKISKRYILAIESHDFETLPARVYVRGFVREYARTLGLRGQEVAESYMSVYRRYREGKG